MKFFISSILWVVVFSCVLGWPQLGHRVRRQMQGLAFNRPWGRGNAFASLAAPRPDRLDGTLGFSHNIFDNDNGRLVGSAQVSKTWSALGGEGPTRVGGALDYTGHGVDAGLKVDHALGGGTTLGVDAAKTWNLSPNTDLKAGGGYSQTFGPGGDKPNYNGMVTLTHRFKKSPHSKYSNGDIFEVEQ